MFNERNAYSPIIRHLRETQIHRPPANIPDITADNVVKQAVSLVKSGRVPEILEATIGDQKGYICHIPPRNCSYFKDTLVHVQGSLAFKKPGQPLIYCQTLFIPEETGKKLKTIRDATLPQALEKIAQPQPILCPA